MISVPRTIRNHSVHIYQVHTGIAGIGRGATRRSDVTLCFSRFRRGMWNVDAEVLLMDVERVLRTLATCRCQPGQRQDGRCAAARSRGRAGRCAHSGCGVAWCRARAAFQRRRARARSRSQASCSAFGSTTGQHTCRATPKSTALSRCLAPRSPSLLISPDTSPDTPQPPEPTEPTEPTTQTEPNHK